MKRLVFLISLLVLSVGLMAQSRAQSKPGSLHIVKEFKPAILSIVGDISFEDATGNNAIDANETCKIVFQVANTGKGDGYGCEVIVKGSGATQGITYANKKLQVIKQNSTQSVEIPISTNMYTIDGVLDLTIEVSEPNGFGTQPYNITLNTKAFEAPYLQLREWALTSSNGASTILQPATQFAIQLLLQNTQYGLAEDVHVDVSVPEGVVFVNDGKNHFQVELGEMVGGAQQSITCELMAMRKYHASTIPVKVSIREKYGKYAESTTFELSFNQTYATKITVEEVKQERQEIALGSLTSDVDKNIPQNTVNNDNTFAFIIANENYKSTNFSHVLHAQNDGKVFADYCRMTLGIPEYHIHSFMDASSYDMHNVLEKQIVNTAEVNPGCHIILYYSGHGAPSEETQEAFLIPVDAQQVDKWCVSLQSLYDNLCRLGNCKVTVFLDACFSGTSREGTSTAMSKGVAITPKKNKIEGNLVVFSAATGDETAWPYKDKGHGMFTYFLLKKLQETSGDVTYKDLQRYLYENVRRESQNRNGKIQTPTINSSPNLGNAWQTWKLM